ncbi:DNA mismatch repair protein MutL [Methanosarcinales archaeon]|uniref:DNA mismatch repair endonuclease MutL n=1 Tax=Candidatus Methanoperedens sp. BLZ2 TaxID=2035255 RepID=UPI000BE364BE|nr:DNA mismatch repair endonuclease MutL [Candidatus Methanoperedens sp. BLZ2]KAB2946086.1 MAG: DNA mismatch repair endonuclease MutL [Candidatus Methanoperedens sp.]MBZ0175028.1 DNA mismatch repair endonuclease MutL [Candidatus Methanoperedens nitroreducens]CAG0956769.1 DNA mismatch repair protein MutL [Methanosarcinales archaeon]MCX9076647.1 DNA mismatch repair endonuclease MutL [Candidatus Methanoperedens sp.]MCX9088312.1 DNA mismatch repair endonuclease MutL [Candidatus Methanoperedens sp.
MGKIQILDEASINKIAAGEVIERPASVVKELVENSIDAGANTIRIEVTKSGKGSIRITDNGCGMSKDDAALSYVKHATSKIRKIEDIETVSTMGFRGEALSSISAIANVEIITKTKDELSGTKVIIQGGNLISIAETGAPDGTTIIVNDLFYNTPVRKKYLKSDAVELTHIIDIVSRIAPGHNNISFSLFNNGKELLRSSAAELQDTIVHIYGQEIAREMLPVNLESAIVRITGFVSRPSLTRGSLDYQSFYINDRNINSRAIGFALRDAYGTLIPKGRFPIAVLKIYVDPREVDVNVHPTKNQVRLSHERDICDMVTQAVRNALSHKDLIPDIKIPTQQLLYETPAAGSFDVKETVSDFRPSVKDTERRLRQSERASMERENTGGAETEIGIEMPDVKVLGQVDSLYILAETKNGLMIIDQHAAHERIFFDLIRESKRDDSQELIVPINLELDPRERVLIKDTIPYLEEFGFRISEFGHDSFAVTAVPIVLGKLEDPGMVHDIISDILSEGKVKEETGIFERVTKSIACRSAIKAGADCSNSQMESLIKQLFKTQNPYTCPHGRPTMVSFNRQELDKLFKRV